MKKVLSLILVVAMMAAFCVTAFAAGSKTDVVEVKPVTPLGPDGWPVVAAAPKAAEEVTVEAVKAAIDEEAKAAFAAAGLDADAAKLTVMEQKEVVAAAKVSVDVPGVAGANVAAFLKTAKAMKLLGVGAAPLEVEVPEAGTLVVVLVG